MDDNKSVIMHGYKQWYNKLNLRLSLQNLFPRQKVLFTLVRAMYSVDKRVVIWPCQPDGETAKQVVAEENLLIFCQG